MTEQEFRKKWAASKDPSIEWSLLAIEDCLIVLGAVLMISAATNFSSWVDAIFRVAFGAALVFGGGVMANNHYVELTGKSGWQHLKTYWQRLTTVFSNGGSHG